MVPTESRGAGLLGALRVWRRVEKKVPMLLVAGPGWDWRMQRDGAGLYPFAVADEAVALPGLAELLEEWLPGQASADPAVRQALLALGEAVFGGRFGRECFFPQSSGGRTDRLDHGRCHRHPRREVFAVQDAPAGTVLQRRDGTMVSVEGEAAPLESEDGGLLGTVTVFRVAGVEKPEATGGGELATAIADPVFVLDAAGRITFVNEAAGGYLDLPREQVLGRDFWIGLPPEIRERFRPIFETVRREEPRHLRIRAS